MTQRDLICIGCPLGCNLSVTVQDNGTIDVTGNTCNRGAEYARKEMTDPRRIVTSTVRVSGAKETAVSVKTKSDIPKGKIFDCMQALAGVTVAAPISIGDVVLSDVAHTGVDVVATKNMELA